MKTAMLFVGPDTQAVLTPETEAETILLETIAEEGRLVASLYWAQFFACRGGYYRMEEREGGGGETSLIVRLQREEKAPELRRELDPPGWGGGKPRVVEVEASDHTAEHSHTPSTRFVRTPHGDVTLNGPYLAVAYVGDLAGFGVGDQCQCDFPCPIEANTRWDVCAKCHLPTFPVKGGSTPPPKGRV